MLNAQGYQLISKKLQFSIQERPPLAGKKIFGNANFHSESFESSENK